MTRATIDSRQPRMERGNGYGQYTLVCLKRGKEVRQHSTDSRLWDALQSAEYKSREWYSLRRSIIKQLS